MTPVEGRAHGRAATLGVNRVHFPVTVLGYGTRLGIWVQGCGLACRGCMARDTWDPLAGTEVRVPDLARLWRHAVRLGADGVTISGGEPLDQPGGLAALLGALTAVRARLASGDTSTASEPRRELDIMVYTGYELAELSAAQRRAVRVADVLITGRFDVSKPTRLIWRGSANQRMVLRTPLGRRRYAAMVDHEPAKAPMQASVRPEGVWLIGVPRVGDLRRLDAGLRRHGITASSATWRGGSGPTGQVDGRTPRDLDD